MSDVYYISERDNLLVDTVGELRTFLLGDPDDVKGDVGWPDIFPQFESVNIGSTHPFAVLESSRIGNRRIPGGLFPSVTVAIPSESDNENHLNYALEAEEVTVDMVNAWIDVDQKKRLISTKKLQELLAIAQQRAAAATKLWSTVRTYREDEQLAFAVWADNDTVGHSLWQLVRAFCNLHRAFFETYGFENITASGSQTGQYNLDLGRILYGGDYVLSGMNATVDRTIDTSWETILAVKHSVAHGDITT